MVAFQESDREVLVSIPSVLTDGQRNSKQRVALATSTEIKPTSTKRKIMSWIRVWIHLVFTTRNRKPFLHSEEIRLRMFQHIKENAINKDIWMDCVNGYDDHAHCLLSLGKEQNISKVAQLIKGESSYWINKSGLIDHKFVWQDDYWAVSVSESHLKAVRRYIHLQEEHHRKVSFSEEIEEFMEKYGWERINGS